MDDFLQIGAIIIFGLCHVWFFLASWLRWKYLPLKPFISTIFLNILCLFLIISSTFLSPTSCNLYNATWVAATISGVPLGAKLWSTLYECVVAKKLLEAFGTNGSGDKNLFIGEDGWILRNPKYFRKNLLVQGIYTLLIFGMQVSFAFGVGGVSPCDASSNIGFRLIPLVPAFIFDVTLIYFLSRPKFASINPWRLKTDSIKGGAAFCVFTFFLLLRLGRSEGTQNVILYLLQILSYGVTFWCLFRNPLSHAQNMANRTGRHKSHTDAKGRRNEVHDVQEYLDKFRYEGFKCFLTYLSHEEFSSDLFCLIKCERWKSDVYAALRQSVPSDDSTLPLNNKDLDDFLNRADQIVIWFFKDDSPFLVQASPQHLDSLVLRLSSFREEMDAQKAQNQPIEQERLISNRQSENLIQRKTDSAVYTAVSVSKPVPFGSIFQELVDEISKRLNNGAWSRYMITDRKDDPPHIESATDSMHDSSIIESLTGDRPPKSPRRTEPGPQQEEIPPMQLDIVIQESPLDHPHILHPQHHRPPSVVEDSDYEISATPVDSKNLTPIVASTPTPLTSTPLTSTSVTSTPLTSSSVTNSPHRKPVSPYVGKGIHLSPHLSYNIVSSSPYPHSLSPSPAMLHSRIVPPKSSPAYFSRSVPSSSSSSLSSASKTLSVPRVYLQPLSTTPSTTITPTPSPSRPQVFFTRPPSPRRFPSFQTSSVSTSGPIKPVIDASTFSSCSSLSDSSISVCLGISDTKKETKEEKAPQSIEEHLEKLEQPESDPEIPKLDSKTKTRVRRLLQIPKTDDLVGIQFQDAFISNPVFVEASKQVRSIERFKKKLQSFESSSKFPTAVEDLEKRLQRTEGKTNKVIVKLQAHNEKMDGFVKEVQLLLPTLANEGSMKSFKAACDRLSANST